MYSFVNFCVIIIIILSSVLSYCDYQIQFDVKNKPFTQYAMLLNVSLRDKEYIIIIYWSNQF